MKSAIHVHEILSNHNYLMYYPTSQVLHRLAEHYAQEKNVDAMVELSHIYAVTHFLKVDARSLDVMSHFAIE